MARSLIPNSTQVPDVILDHWMAALSGAEFKVLLYIARRTYGFGKDSDNISLNQLSRGIRRRDGTQLDHGTGLSRSGVKAACVSLIEKGILLRFSNTAQDGREPEESTYRLNLFAELPGDDEEERGVGQNLAHVSQEKTYPEVGQKSAQVGHKRTGGRPQKHGGVGQNLALQDTEQETVQETAAAPPLAQVEPASDAVADSLVQELIGHGVGGKVAARLARDKPEVCRRCLEYLPFADIRTTPGAWLANAIEEEFGPPERFVRAKHEATKDKTTAPKTTTANEEARHAANVARLRVSYAQFEKTQPDALSDFTEFVAAERVKAERFSHQLSERGRADYLGQFENEEHRLSLFEWWLNARQKRHASAPPRAASDALQSAP